MLRKGTLYGIILSKFRVHLDAFLNYMQRKAARTNIFSRPSQKLSILFVLRYKTFLT